MTKTQAKFIISICFILFAKNILIHAQNNNETYAINTNNQLIKLKKLKLFDSVYTISHNASIYFYKKKDYNLAIFYALQEVEVGKRILDQKKHKKSIYNLGRFYYLNNQYFNSIKAYKKVIDSFEVDEKTYQAYCETGRAYKELGDYYLAVDYFKKGLSKPKHLKLKSYINQHINLAYTYNNIETKESLNQELIIINKLDSLINQNPNIDVNYLLNHLKANHYYTDLTFNFKKSRFFYKKNLKILLKDKDTLNILKSYNNLGDLYNKAENDSALFYIQKGIHFSNKKRDVLSNLHHNLADFYSRQKETKKALTAIHKSIQITIPVEIEDDYRFIPTITNAALSYDKYLLIYSLKSKASSYMDLFDETNNHQNLVLGLANLELADKLIDIIKLNSTENNSKLFWQKEASEIYMLAVKTCHLLGNIEKAFYFIEKNKAILLLENITENEIKNKLNLPIILLEKELELKQKISNLETELAKSKNSTDSIKNEYYDYKIKYKEFIESLKNRCPEYYNYKSPITILTLKEVQKNLQKNTMVIQYLLNKVDGYVLTITKNTALLSRLNDTEKLNISINNYAKQISKPYKKNEDIEIFNTTSNQLYNLLFPLNKEGKIKDYFNLIIVPDYTLQNIPFETLKTNSNEYLISNHEISYAYSLSFLNHNTSVIRKAKNDFIGYAPISFNYENISELRNSKTELINANSYYSGDIITDSLATKANFLENSNAYKIIHLSTHANANDSIQPWIAFKNKKMYLNELYTTKNQAELVVLSACNTSLGKINSGEGVFSLARGFFYSGANSVVSSLWNVNDKANEEITTSFYHYLKHGKTKSASLRQAKLDYLNTHSLSETSPYYWSSLILIGNNSAITFKINTLYYKVLAISLLLILFFIFYFKKNKING